jgi:hypothetical protein
MTSTLTERAERAGRFLPLREQALADDTDLLAIRFTAQHVQADEQHEPLVFDPDDLDARAVERMATEASKDDGYRVQLLDLAALHGSVYLRAANALYAVEARTLGRFEALARLVLDQRQLAQARAGNHPNEGDFEH